MRCPNCHATNPESATFCGQCFQRFGTETPPDAPALPTRGAPAGTAPSEWEPAPQSPLESSAEATSGRFKVAGDRVSWTCAVCGEDNEVGVFSCAVCGSRMDAEQAGEEAVDWEEARRVELLAPGLGHYRAGAHGMGIARLTMVLLWLVGAVLLALGGLLGLVTAIPLVLGVVIIWATGPGDLRALRAGRAGTLDARRFMYLVVGVLIGVIVIGGIGVAL